MGTPSEWLRVAAFGGWYGFFYWFLYLMWDAPSFSLNDLRFRLNLFGIVMFSCSVGMFHVFEWSSLRGAKAIIFVTTTLGTLIVGLAKRRARRNAEESQGTP